MLPNPPAVTSPSTKSKVVYIDRIKVLLTCLVILHHTFIAYGAPGGWYYAQKTKLLAAIIPMTAFVATNQSFFMGMFFFLSALFIPSSYKRKGPLKFLIDRLIRLGIPLVFYSVVLSPILSYLVYRFADGNQITYFQYLGGFHDWVDFGVLWFVAALLLFTVVYVVWRVATPNFQTQLSVPRLYTILLFAVGIGVVSYLVRIFFPVGWVLKPLGFQLGHFSQYIALFILGLIASGNNWLGHLDTQTGKSAAIIACCLVCLGFPLFFVVQQLLKFPVEWFNVGGHWESLWYAVWEQLTGFSIITALLVVGRNRWNKHSAFLNILSRSTFAVYIFHPLIVIACTAAVSHWQIEPALKLLLFAPVAVMGSFLLGMLIVRIPGVNKIV